MVNIYLALEYAMKYGQAESKHHKAWVIDMMVRCLTGCPTTITFEPDGRHTHETIGIEESAEYKEFVSHFPLFEYDRGIAP